MDLVTANIMVDTFIATATDLQTLAKEETDPRVVKWLLAKAAEYAQNAADIMTLPLEGWDWQIPAVSAPIKIPSRASGD